MHSTPSPTKLDLTAAFHYERGVGRADLLQLRPQLELARKHVLSALDNGPAWESAWQANALLESYQRQRRSSLLWRLLQTSAVLRDEVDRLVVVGSPPLIAASKALFAACCHPYHNQLTRGERGGRPRIFFAPAEPDNDALQGLFDLLPRRRKLQNIEERWGVLGLDDPCGDPLIVELFALFCEALQSTTDSLDLNQAVCMGFSNSPAMHIAEAVNGNRWVLDDGENGAESSVFGAFNHPGVFLAASLMGMDLVQYLRGAAAMAERFESSPVGDNPPMDLAGLLHLLQVRHQFQGFEIASGLSALKPLADYFSVRGQSEARLLLQLAVESVRRDRLCITMSRGKTASGRSRNVSRTLADVAAENQADVRNRRVAAAQPTAVVQLPAVDEYAVGQLTQMLTIVVPLAKSLTSSPDS